jgi:hypothetical protein
MILDKTHCVKIFQVEKEYLERDGKGNNWFKKSRHLIFRFR